MRTSTWITVAAVTVVSACGGGVVTSPNDAGGGGLDAGAETSAADAPFTDPSTTPCGAKRCAAEEFCIVPCAGGTLASCAPEGDDGCPKGTVRGTCLGDAGPTTTGCAPAPPPPYCSREPSCGGDTTGIREGKTIDCICP